MRESLVAALTPVPSPQIGRVPSGQVVARSGGVRAGGMISFIFVTSKTVSLNKFVTFNSISAIETVLEVKTAV
jgi:hypothetical protein